MAKKLFTTYRAPVDSYPLGEQNIGLLKPGRYSGYDLMITRGALDISIKHSGTVRKTGKDNNYAPLYGAILFGSGIILHDEDNINLVVDSNSGNANVRTDFVIVENTYQEISGGTPPIYSIIKGPSDGTLPILPNPSKQILIGRIYIEGNGYLFTNLTYVPERAPLPGDITYQSIIQIVTQSINIPNASTTQRGIVQQSTQDEVNTGTEDTKYITPKGLHNKKADQNSEGIIRVAKDSEIIAGDATNLAINAKQFRGKDRKVSLDTSYTLKNEDVGKIFLGMGSSTIDIYIPNNLDFNSNLWWGFISVNCNIRISDSGGGVTLLKPAGKLAETKGLNCTMLLESLGSNKYVVAGTLKAQ